MSQKISSLSFRVGSMNQLEVDLPSQMKRRSPNEMIQYIKIRLGQAFTFEGFWLASWPYVCLPNFNPSDSKYSS